MTLQVENERPVCASLKEAARFYGVSPRTIYRMGERGQLHLFKVGGSTRVLWDELEAQRREWMAEAGLELS